MDGLIDHRLKSRADLPDLRRRYVVVVSSSELEHDGVSVELRSESASVNKE